MDDEMECENRARAAQAMAEHEKLLRGQAGVAGLGTYQPLPGPSLPPEMVMPLADMLMGCAADLADDTTRVEQVIGRLEAAACLLRAYRPMGQMRPLDG